MQASSLCNLVLETFAYPFVLQLPGQLFVKPVQNNAGKGITGTFI